MTTTNAPASQSNTGDFEISADPSKYVTLPVQNETLWRKYQLSLDLFWTVHEVNVEKDRKSLLETFSDPNQRQYLRQLIAFMSITHNTIVTKELFLDLINHVDIKEASYYFGSQADSKKTHSMMYSLLLDQLIETKDDSPDSLAEERAKLVSDVAQTPEVRDLLRWYVESINLEKESFAKRMFALATLQGIVFAVPLLTISWLEKNYPQTMSGLMKSNQLIWRDEKLNLSFSCKLFDYIQDEIDSDTAQDIVRKSVTLVHNLFTNALPVSKFGIGLDAMFDFIRHEADRILTETNHETIYNIEGSPFDWVVEPKLASTHFEIPYLDRAHDSTPAQNKFEIDDDF